MLYKIKNGNKLKVEDLRGIASFNRIVMNYMKMLRIEKKLKESQETRNCDTQSLF